MEGPEGHLYIQERESDGAKRGLNFILYFKSQAAEDQKEANRLERKLKELHHDVDCNFFQGIIMKEVEYLEKIPQSEEHEHLGETLESLEEYLPEIEQLQEELTAMNVDGLELLPLTEVFAKRIDMLRRMIDEAYLKDFASSMREKAFAIRNIEDFLELLAKNMRELGPEEEVVEFEGYQHMADIQNLTEILEEATWFIGNRPRLLVKETEITALIEGWLNKYEERCTSEYFATNVEIMRKDLAACVLFIEKLKAYKSMQVIENDSLIITPDIDEYLASIERYSQFEKAQAFVKKTREHLPEWRTVEKELLILQKAGDDEFGQSKEDKEGKYKETARFKELKGLIAKYDSFWMEFYKEIQQLEIFSRKASYARIEVTDAFNKLCDAGTRKGLEAQLKEFENALNEFRTKMSNFGDLSYEINSDIKRWNMQVLTQRKTFHDGYIDPVIKDFTNKLEEVQEATEELVLFRDENKKGSQVVETLHEQLRNLRALDHDKLSSTIQRLDEIAIELKALDDQVKAIKMEVTEEALTIAGFQRQIANLRRFSNEASVNPIIVKFKDIITSPFMLRMLVQTLVKYPKSSANKAELYRLFSNIHFEREKERLLKAEKIPPKFSIMHAFYGYSVDLAINMFIKKVTSIQLKNSGYERIGIIMTEKKDIWNRFFDDSNIMIRLARRGAQIAEDDGVARFAHKSIMEYFAARQFYDDVVDYNPDKPESYNPCLNAGSIIDSETAVYHFLKDISQSNTNQKKKDTLTVFDKKLLQILNSSTLQKLYGDDLEQNFFYPNIFLMLLLRDNLQLRISMLKEDSLGAKILEKIVSWMFNLSGSASEAGQKFAEMVERANRAGLMSQKVLQQILCIHHHLITKKPDVSCCEDRFLTEKNNIEVKGRISIAPLGKSIILKDGVLLEPKQITDEKGKLIEVKEDWAWILSGKLFIHGSQDSIVILKHDKDNKCLGVSRSTENEPRYLDSMLNLQDFALNDVKSAWDMIEYKWLLRFNNSNKTEFILLPLTNSSKFIHGRLRNEEEYLTFFKGLCTYDVHSQSIDDYILNCLTCSPNGGSKYVACKNCIEICHKGHQVVVQRGGNGYCGCRFEGKCKIAFGCTEKLSKKYRDDLKFKCTECPADKKNIILCNGCKYDHEHKTGHKSFDDVITSGKCECDCVSNKTRVIVETTTYHSVQNAKYFENEQDDENDDEQSH